MSLFAWIRKLLGLSPKTTTTSTTTHTTTTNTTTKQGGLAGVKRAICIGINNYPGTQNDLRGCINDAKAWGDLFKSKYGFNEVQFVFDQNATCKNVKNTMVALIKKSVPGDEIVVTYSGHGSKVTDTNGDEDDRIDETWYLYDGNFIDDQLKAILDNVKEGVKLTIVSDSCHSGTVTRALLSTLEGESVYAKPRYMPPKDSIEAAQIGAVTAERAIGFPEEGMNHILLSGAKSTEYSYDAYFDKPMGAMTYYATTILNQTPDITWKEFHKQLRTKLPSGRYPQSPCLEGPDSLKNQKVFE